MKKILLSFLLFFIIITAQNNNSNYLNQSEPGNEAKLFAPGIISTGLNDRDISISPDGDEILFGVTEKPHYVIVRIRKKDGKWGKPEIAPFSGKYDDFEAQYSPDGNRIYFASNRPFKDGDPQKDTDIWYVEKENGDWGKPINIGKPVNSEKDEFYPSVTKDGSIYLTTFDMKIAKAEFKDGKYSSPVVLSDSINSGRAEYNAFVAPDESYLIFTSHGWDRGRGRGDLFISYKKPDNEWTTPKSLSTGVNSRALEMCPHVSPGGKYLFFASMRRGEKFDPEPIRSYDEIAGRSSKVPENNRFDIYWVSGKIIDKLKPEYLK